MIVSWSCHICAKEFDKYDGGVCARCNKSTCLGHLKLIDYEPVQGPARSEQIASANCVRPTEKASQLKRRFFAENGWVRRLAF